MTYKSWLSGVWRTQVQRRAGVVLVALAAGMALLLRLLPYSSVRIAAVEALEVDSRPSPDFAIGPLYWPVTALTADPALQPFREAMKASCDATRGLAAAACVSQVLSERFPAGGPSTEYVNVAFDPVAHFKSHMAGEPGHCLTRSAILATELLSVGVPARVLQMLPPSGKGHTVVSVWDDDAGWTVVDPSTRGYLAHAPGQGSAAELRANPQNIRWKPFAPSTSSVSETEAETRQFRELLSGDLLYPEPWLYLRRGGKVAPWPFRGHYARVGPTFIWLGPLQGLLVWAIPVLLVVGSVLFIGSWWRAERLAEASRGDLADAQPRAGDFKVVQRSNRSPAASG